MANIEPYMEKYEHEHHNVANRVLHAIGIPCIFAGIIVTAINWQEWRWGLVFFLGGWVMLFLGHRIEGNNPAFFQGPIYFLVGPIWVAKEILGWFTGKRPERAESKAPN
jgi:hypothetical protein